MPFIAYKSTWKNDKKNESGLIVLTPGIWQADTLYGPYVGSPARRAYMQAIVDDKSRKVVAARFVARDDAPAFQGTLRAAVASHGIPEKLFVDYAAESAKPQIRTMPLAEAQMVPVFAA